MKKTVILVFRLIIDADVRWTYSNVKMAGPLTEAKIEAAKQYLQLTVYCGEWQVHNVIHLDE